MNCLDKIREMEKLDKLRAISKIQYTLLEILSDDNLVNVNKFEKMAMSHMKSSIHWLKQGEHDASK